MLWILLDEMCIQVTKYLKIIAAQSALYNCIYTCPYTWFIKNSSVNGEFLDYGSLNLDSICSTISYYRNSSFPIYLFINSM